LEVTNKVFSPFIMEHYLLLRKKIKAMLFTCLMFLKNIKTGSHPIMGTDPKISFPHLVLYPASFPGEEKADANQSWKAEL
jgi:hypothetical protein